MPSRLLAVSFAILLLSGCASMPNPLGSPSQASSPAAAAVTSGGTGAASGAVVGGAPGNDPRVAALIGAGVGALSGPAIGSYMDQEEADLRAKLQNSGISVVRSGEQIVLVVPVAITFDTDKANVKPQFTATLSGVGALLKKYDKTVIDVLGYTDDQGADATNKSLSQRRAVSVAAALSGQGVDQRRFFIQGRGEANPVAPNTTEVGRAQNRRVEIQISPIT